MRKCNWFLMALLMPLLLWQCGQEATSSGDSGDDTEANVSSGTGNEGGSVDTDDPAKMMEEAMKQLQNLQGGEKVEVVNFRELKKFLPESLAGLNRTSHTGEKAGAMGFTISQAEAKYENADRSKRMDVNIIDGGGVGLAQMGYAAWASVEIDQEDDNGWTRTTTINGHKAYHEHDTRNGDGQISAIISGRGIVSIDYEGLSDSEATKAIKGLDFKGLESLFSAAQ